MKTIYLLISVAALCATTFFTGCNTTVQQTAFPRLYAVEVATTAAYDAYVRSVLLGKVATNDLPRVSKAFNTFQASALVALDTVSFNTNALCPPTISTLSQDVLNLISIAQKGK